MNKIELLAPVSSFEGLKVVINAGADAVYIGGTKFGARAYADNLDTKEMIEAINYAHLYNVKVYLTVNVLLKEIEITDELYDYILPFYQVGLDGVIVQDIGVLEYLDKTFPNLEKHASTQMTLVSYNADKLMNMYNVTRIVPSRELSLTEIEDLVKNTNLEIEVFVHGALCYCYSGQCLMSSLIGDRSGNRGRCAQPCRKQYELLDDRIKGTNQGYLLSPSDLCGLYNLHNLIKIGVNSLKIEGRMKNTSYAACIVSTYRKYIDMYYRLGHEEYRKYIDKHVEEFMQDIVNMQDIYNRGGYTKGYFSQYNGIDIMSTKLPSHFGTYVGKVVKVNSHNVEIKLEKDINAKDVLEIRPDLLNSNNKYEFTVKDEHSKDSFLITNYFRGLKLYKGQRVYRVKNNSLIDTLKEKYIDSNKKIPLELEIIIKREQPIVINAGIYGSRFTYTYDGAQPAMNRPITADNVKKQFMKLSNTNYELVGFEVNLEDGLFLPLKVLNDIRRDVIENVSRDYVAKHNRDDNLDRIIVTKTRYKQHASMLNNMSILVADCRQLKQLTYLLEKYNNMVKRIYIELDGFGNENIVNELDRIKNMGIQIYIALPRILRLKGLEYVRKNCLYLLNNINIDGVLARNIEAVELIRKDVNKDLDIVLDSNMYITNSFAIHAWHKYGVDGFTHSYELSKDEIENLYGDIDDELMEKVNFESVIYAKPVVMVSVGCVKKTNNICNHVSEIVYMKDSYGKVYPVRCVCDYCYNLIYNEQPINLINELDGMADSYRIEFLNETVDEMEQVLEKIINGHSVKGDYKGHYYNKLL